MTINDRNWRQIFAVVILLSKSDESDESELIVYFWENGIFNIYLYSAQVTKLSHLLFLLNFSNIFRCCLTKHSKLNKISDFFK